MPNQILKETIADYGLEETLAAMIELTKEGYILKYYPLQSSNFFKFMLEEALGIWTLYHSDKALIDSDKALIDFDYKEAQINEDLCQCQTFLK
jgi:hypothetical protein